MATLWSKTTINKHKINNGSKKTLTFALLYIFMHLKHFRGINLFLSLDYAHFSLHFSIYFKTLRIWKIKSNWNCIPKAKEHQARFNKEKKFAQYIYTIFKHFCQTSWKMTRFLQQKKSVLDLNFTHSFFGKCKTILIRPLKHSIHYFLNIFFLSSICLLLIFFFFSLIWACLWWNLPFRFCLSY